MAKLKDTTIEKATTGGQNQIQFKEAGTTKTQITSNYGDDKFYLYHEGDNRMVIDSDGRVGFGTSSPGQKVQVAGNIKVDSSSFASLILDRPTTGSGSVVQFENNNGIIGGIGAYGDDGLQFRTTDGTQMVINASNNVGIGTTSPGRQLEVNGEGVMRLDATSGDPGIDFQTAGSQDMQFRYRASSDYLGIYSYGTTSDVMAIRKSDGYVGIGVTSPSYKLDVDGSIKLKNNYQLYMYNSDNYIKYNYWRVNTGSNVNIFNQGNSDIVLSTNNAEKMRIKADGKVGIGTTSPDEKLHIEGNILVDAYNNSPGDSGIFFREGYTASQPSGAEQPYNVSITLYDGANGGASYDGLAINGFDGVAIRTNNDSTPKMVIAKDGDVGIGASSQAAIYHDLQVGSMVSTTTVGTLGIKSNGSGYAILMEEPGASSETYAIGVDANGNLNFYNSASSTPAVKFMDNDRVGIGASSPQGKLTVEQDMTNGGSAFSTPHFALRASNTVDSTGFVGMTMSTSTADNYGWSYGAQRTSSGIGDLYWRNHSGTSAGNDRMILTSGGNLGLGTTTITSGFKLEVNGKVKASNGRLGNIQSNSSDVDRVNFTFNSQTNTLTITTTG